jgi:hypothetical protein
MTQGGEVTIECSAIGLFPGKEMKVSHATLLHQLVDTCTTGCKKGHFRQTRRFYLQFLNKFSVVLEKVSSISWDEKSGYQSHAREDRAKTRQSLAQQHLRFLDLSNPQSPPALDQFNLQLPLLRIVGSLPSLFVRWAAENVNREVVEGHVYGPEVSSHNLRLFRLQGTPPSFPLTAEQATGRGLKARMNHNRSLTDALLRDLPALAVRAEDCTVHLRSVLMARPWR